MPDLYSWDEMEQDTLLEKGGGGFPMPEIPHDIVRPDYELIDERNTDPEMQVRYGEPFTEQPRDEDPSFDEVEIL